MEIAALITWIITALGGFFLLATWISRGGHRQPTTSRFPPALIFGHFVLAATGLVLWIIYVATDSDALGWIAFIVLLVVAALGFTMLARWIPTYRARATASATPAAAPVAAESPAEGHFPVAVVAGHGVLAAVTLVLVLLTDLGVGGS
jgi:hypothetical protein